MSLQPSHASHFSSMRRTELISLIEGICVALDQHERSLQELMTRWGDEVSAEIRAELMDMYHPLLLKMIELGIRPLPR